MLPLAAMRVFFALVPDEELRAKLRELAQVLMDRIGGRAVPVANLHLTLAFLGDVADDRVPRLREIVDALPRERFSLVLDRIGEWHYAGVAWIAPTAVPAPLATLHARLGTALASADFTVEARPFRPHVTILRRPRRALAESACPPREWCVARVSLMRSDNVEGAMRYREVSGAALDA
jgi:2'-5' RNA ligase